MLMLVRQAVPELNTLEKLMSGNRTRWMAGLASQPPTGRRPLHRSLEQRIPSSISSWSGYQCG
jgi:hypothetical protein